MKYFTVLFLIIIAIICFDSYQKSIDETIDLNKELVLSDASVELNNNFYRATNREIESLMRAWENEKMQVSANGNGQVLKAVNEKYNAIQKAKSQIVDSILNNVKLAESEKLDLIERIEMREQENLKFKIKVIISIGLLLFSLIIIFMKRFDENTKKWAFSVISLITGVWIGTAI